MASTIDMKARLQKLKYEMELVTMEAIFDDCARDVRLQYAWAGAIGLIVKMQKRLEGKHDEPAELDHPSLEDGSFIF